MEFPTFILMPPPKIALSYPWHYTVSGILKQENAYKGKELITDLIKVIPSFPLPGIRV